MDMQSIHSDLNTILDDLAPPETTVPQKERVVRSLREIQRLTQEVLNVLEGLPAAPPTATNLSSPINGSASPALHFEDLSKILEGHFNGEKMIGDDGREYNVPPNYASKSKLVTGDRMKLTITATGAFIYKQIGPIERKRVIGTLYFEEAHTRWTVVTPEKTFKVLPASISFYKGKPGDEVILFVPEHTPAEWGAVDQLIAK